MIWEICITGAVHEAIRLKFWLQFLTEIIYLGGATTCEGLGVKFPGPTRQNETWRSLAACPLPPAADIRAYATRASAAPVDRTVMARRQGDCSERYVLHTVRGPQMGRNERSETCSVEILRFPDVLVQRPTNVGGAGRSSARPLP
jgi:hypothetical protein